MIQNFWWIEISFMNTHTDIKGFSINIFIFIQKNMTIIIEQLYFRFIIFASSIFLKTPLSR